MNKSAENISERIKDTLTSMFGKGKGKISRFKRGDRLKLNEF